MKPGGHRPRVPKLAMMELTREEAHTLAGLARARLAEVERMVMGISEGEGMDLPRHNALKSLDAQLELLQDLVMKLDAAAKEAA